MKKQYSGLGKIILNLSMQLWVVSVLRQPALAGQQFIPGFYGNAANILPTPAPYMQPSGESIITGIDSISRTGNAMTVNQNKPRAVIHWKNFDIGSEASVHFNQQNSSWKALNRVTGDGYTQIMGQLTADGQVYILNQNGILFGAGSQVNVHGLTATALDINDPDFYDATRSSYFKDFSEQGMVEDISKGGAETYSRGTGSTDATVANHGSITARTFGSVMLVGPNVENNGTITAPGGDIALLAGDEVTISQDEFGIFYYTIDSASDISTATNFAGGTLYADQGKVSMQASFVNQHGLIRSVTALAKEGKIELKATKKVHLGKNSHTEILVSESGERKPGYDKKFDKGTISISATDGSVEHQGHILAKGQNVTITARDRVLVDEGSTIDVSGSKVELKAADRIVEVKLDSEELRDEFLYKNGPLKGKKIEIDITQKFAIGDISGYLTSLEKSAPELTTQGGTVQIEATGDNGEVIVKNNASLDFSGGGLLYGDGFIEETKVRVGQKIYSLAELPAGTPIDEVLGHTAKEHTRYGLTDEWDGIYYGGATPIRSYLPSFWQGADGGKLQLVARKVVLDGTLNGSVERGIYQDHINELLEDGVLAAVGRKAPRAGTLEIGNSVPVDTPPNAPIDLRTDAIVITKQVAATTIAAEEPLADEFDPIRLSTISADTINAAKIGTLGLYANNTVEIAADADLVLHELGKFDVAAKSIVHKGEVRIPSGTVQLTTYPFATSPDPRKGIVLADGGTLDVSGKRIDNSKVAHGTPYEFGFTHGGTVILKQQDEFQQGAALILAQSSAINVNSGYIIDNDGSVSSDNAGTIDISGNILSLGKLYGMAVLGQDGGTLSLRAENDLVVSATDTISESAPADLLALDPELLQRPLTLGDRQFADSGFSHIRLNSVSDLYVENGAELSPSAARIAQPAKTIHGFDIERTTTIAALPEEFGASSLLLAAGLANAMNYTVPNAELRVGEGSNLSVAPVEGDISLIGPSVTIAGTITAKSGNVSVTSTFGDISLLSGAGIDVSGATLPDYANTVPFLPVNEAVFDGGSVSLASEGNLYLHQGSVIDASGSDIASRYVVKNGKIHTNDIASAAGSVTVSYQDIFDADGGLIARSALPWLTGGTLSLEQNAESTMTVHEDAMRAWRENGFDKLTLSSRRELGFVESELDEDTTVSIDMDRQLVLNASAIIAGGNRGVAISAPWVRLTNTVLDSDRDYSGYRAIDASADTGESSLLISADSLDVEGNIALSGFADTTIRLSNDLRLYDYLYMNALSGLLHVAGDLAILAEAIYPAMHHTLAGTNDENKHQITPSSFTINATLPDEDGNNISRITILPASGKLEKTISSAGGRLELQAGDIENYGVLAAPMGKIVLSAENRIWLGDGSVLSTKGEGLNLYGQLNNGQWTVDGYMNPSLAGDTGYNFASVVDGAPEKGITLDADEIKKGITLDANEIIQMPDATIDVNGGGTIFSYQFLPGFSGSNNPINRSNRYVILPDQSVVLPGSSVHLDQSSLLAEGEYSLLPEEYAFLPGAMIIEVTSQTLLPGEQLTTLEGYDMVAGFLSDSSVNTLSPLRNGFIVRSAAEVLKEGKFDIHSFIAGDAGTVRASGSSTVLAGKLAAQALEGFLGGILQLSGEKMVVGSSSSLDIDGLLKQMSFEDALPTSLAGTMFLDSAKISNTGLRELKLGDDDTQTITLRSGSTIDGVSTVRLTASSEIHLEENTAIHAVAQSDDEEGTLSLQTGTLYGETSTTLHASDELRLNLENMSADTFQGAIQVDSGTLTVSSGILFLEPDNYSGSRTGTGVYLSSPLLDTFKSIDSVVLESGSDILFLGSMNLLAKGDLAFDAANLGTDAPGYTIFVNAGDTLSLRNSDAVATADGTDNTSSITLSAATVELGPGELRFDNFNTVNVNSSGDMILKGTGSTTADLDPAGKLSFNAARYLFTAGLTPLSADDEDSVLTVETSDFRLDGGAGDIRFAGNGHSGAQQVLAMPGSLTVNGANIELDGAVFDMPGSSLEFTAANDISVTATSIQATGKKLSIPTVIGGKSYTNTLELAGGQVFMNSAAGAIDIDENSEIDVSRHDGKTGGLIQLSAVTNGVTLDGMILGDSLKLETDSLKDDFSSIAAKALAGGFLTSIDLRSRIDDIIIAASDMVKTSRFILTADQGSITVDGTVDGSGQQQGGTVELYAADTISLGATGKILARGEGGQGGKVLLASTDDGTGTTPIISTENGSEIDVSGASAAQGGEVVFRAARQAIKNELIDLVGQITGASAKEMHAFKTYTDSSITSTDVTTYMNNIKTDMAAMQAIWDYADIDLIPEIEVDSAGSLTVTSGLNTLNTHTTGSNLKGIPAILSLRAGGDLKITSDIIDAPQTSYDSTLQKYIPVQDGIRDSWNFNFIAGADFSSANLLKTQSGTGNFLVGTSSTGNLIYTESGDITFASGNNTSIYARTSGTALPYMSGTETYNIASFDGNISGYAGGDLVLNGGVIQTAVGDIDLQIDNDIEMNRVVKQSIKYYGAIRTTGRAPLASEVPADILDALPADRIAKTLPELHWEYRDGGDIRVSSFGDITGSMSKPGESGWDFAYTFKLTGKQYYAADYGVKGILNGHASSSTPAYGIITMAGGNIGVTADSFTGQAGAFKEGSVDIYATGNIDGRFNAAGGDLTLTSAANIGQSENTRVNLGSGNLVSQSLGLTAYQSIVNPHFSLLTNSWLLTYNEDSAVKINSVLSDVVIKGSGNVRESVLPANLSITAARDIRLSFKNAGGLLLAPSPTAELNIAAGGNIDGIYGDSEYSGTEIYMSAAAPDTVYGEHDDKDDEAAKTIIKYSYNSAKPLHLASADKPETPVTITAGNDISRLRVSAPKRAEISAGNDIRELGYWGQNLRKGDISIISAGNDLIQVEEEGINRALLNSSLGLYQSGQGLLLVKAGNAIDLGRSAGIQSLGAIGMQSSDSSIVTSRINAALFNEDDKDIYNNYNGADIAVIAGYDITPDLEELSDFFAELNAAGTEFSELMATGNQEDVSAAARIKEDMLSRIINPMLEGHATGIGDIAMTESAIKTSSGQDDIHIFAAGKLDVGTSIISEEAKDTSKGILTEAGGDINIFTEGDINVNESRVVSYFGSDVFMLTNHGDINAGRGSKTAVSQQDEDLFVVVGGKRVKKFVAPAPGSGIRALTIDPDGPGPLEAPPIDPDGPGPQKAPEQKITLIAWEGIIDAGEAGIAGDNVILAATEVRNSVNIDSVSNVGVPTTADAGPSVGALSGASTVSESQSATQSVAQTQNIANGKELAETMSKVAEALTMKMLVIKMEGFSDSMSL